MTPTTKTDWGLLRPFSRPRWPEGRFEQRETEQDRNTRLTFTTIFCVVIGGFLSLAAFSFSNRSFWDGASNMAIISLIAGSAFFVGALIGFLFGIPRSINGQQTITKGKSEFVTTVLERGDPINRYEVNTNLELVSDWLTKILVGVGLTQFYNLAGVLDVISSTLALSIDNSPRTKILMMATIVYFVVCGFLAGYLLTRLFLTYAFSEAEEIARTGVEAQEIRSHVQHLINVSLVADLQPQAKQLLKDIIQNFDARSDYHLPLDFQQGSDMHLALRALQKRFLIEAKDGMDWEPRTTVELTPIAKKIVQDIKVQMS